MNDVELLRRYSEERAEAAFRELVDRKLGLVYSAALRQVGGDAHLAMDVAQAVFSALATQGRSLSHHPTLTGWLYTTTRNIAAKMVRARRRRAHWETEASQMNLQPTTHEPDSSAEWLAISRVLDESMHSLSTNDREAVLLRYFENQPITVVSERFGISEDTARKRIERALEKLRRVLQRRGVVSTATALSAALSQGAILQEMPAGVAAIVTQAALPAAATSSAAISGLAWVLSGKVLIVGGALLAVAVGTAFLGSSQTHSNPPETTLAPAREVATQMAVRSVAEYEYDTSDIKVLAAALIARPPSRGVFTAILKKLGSARTTNDLFIELGRQDFSSALGLAAITANIENAKAKAVWGYAEVSPDAALAWALDNPQKSADTTIGNSYVQSWAAGAFAKHRRAVYAFIDRYPVNQEIRTPRHDAIAGIEHRANLLRSTEAYREIFEDPRAPALIISLRSDPRVTGGTADAHLLSLAGNWGRSQPEDMLAFAARTTDPLLRRPLLVAAVGVYVDLDPMPALEWALRVDPDGNLGIVSSGVQNWINKTGDAEAALNWVNAEEHRKALRSQVAGIAAARIGSKNYLRGYEIALAIPDEIPRRKAAQDVALHWRRDEAHFNHVKQSGNPELMLAAIFHYAGKQHEWATRLINLMPAGPLRAAAEERVRSAQKTPEQ